MWVIQEQPSFYSRSRTLRLTYGECPSDFKQIMQPNTLETGHLYRVSTCYVNELFKKNGPNQYEHYSWERYRKDWKNGSFHAVK